MSFTVKLGVNSAENNKIKKGDFITYSSTISATLRDRCSIIDPVLEVTGDISTFAGYNYVEIPKFKRKYFITNITSVRTGLVSIVCHCDVLYSFADAILECSGLVKKSSNDWNLYLNDGTLKVNQYANYKTYYFPNGFTTQEFILAVAGG